MKERLKTKEPGKWVESIIGDFINHSPENTLKNSAKAKAWDDPLVGFSGGDDPIYQAYKEEYVGPFHWTPLELFKMAFPQSKVGANELTIISWVLPQMGPTKADLRREWVFPSESWTRARIFGEEVNAKLRKHVVDTLQASGIEAVAPMLFSEWGTRLSDRFGFASTWSERHAAHASGLGTFGLCDGLITPRGKAMRAGSVVARVHIPPTPRPYKDHRAYCLFFSQGTCGKCIDQCPIRAISRSGHDKVKCKSFLDMTRNYVLSHHGFEGYGCGFCQVGVPCESKIPGPEEGK
jgi:ferredoxin